MALPNNGEISNYRVPQLFEGGRGNIVYKFEDHESGGTGLNQSSEGLDVLVWSAEISEDGKQVILTNERDIPPQVVYEGDNLQELSITFDQLMNLTLAVVDNGETFLRWYDTVAGEMTTTSYGTDLVSPKVSLDNKHVSDGTSDIIFAYIRDNRLYYRMQRDRYQTEYKVSDRPVRRIQKIGMTVGSRFQFLCLV